MHASRLFKCFFFFSFFFFERRDWEIPPLEKFLSISNVFPVFSTLGDLRITRHSIYTSLVWQMTLLSESLVFFSLFSYETYLVKYSSSALRILYQASTYQCESCPEVWTLMHRHYFVSLYIPLISFIRENFWQSYELNEFFFFERLDVEG